MKTLNFYHATAQKSDSIENLGIFFEMPELDDFFAEYRGFDIHLSSFSLNITREIFMDVLGIDEDEMEDFDQEDIQIEIENNKQDFAQFAICEIEGEESFLGSIPAVNEKTDQLIEEVRREIAVRLNRRWFKKYDEIDGVTTRLADHTHNPLNGRNDVNLVIAEKDMTADKFVGARTDLFFNNDSSVKEIVDEFFEIVDYVKACNNG